MQFYVYVILCEDGTFYTGYSRNLNSRIKRHMKGEGARYTRIHKPKKLVYSEKLGSQAEAMKRERRIKTFTHRQKLELVNSHIKSRHR